jgi:hypothetical protein
MTELCNERDMGSVGCRYYARSEIRYRDSSRWSE